MYVHIYIYVCKYIYMSFSLSIYLYIYIKGCLFFPPGKFYTYIYIYIYIYIYLMMPIFFSQAKIISTFEASKSRRFLNKSSLNLWSKAPISQITLIGLFGFRVKVWKKSVYDCRISFFNFQ